MVCDLFDTALFVMCYLVDMRDFCVTLQCSRLVDTDSSTHAHSLCLVISLLCCDIAVGARQASVRFRDTVRLTC